MKPWPLALIACILLAGVSLRAEPENILVDKYTFIRPAAWKWRAPGEKWSALSRFQISADDAPRPTEARFYLINSDKSDLRKRVHSNFKGKVQEKEERSRVGAVELVFVTVIGTAIDKDTKDDPRPDHQFTGVFLPADAPGKTVFIRLFGPKTEAGPAFPEFKRMIEQAVKDSQ